MLQDDLQHLYKRDLNRLIENLEKISEEKLWEVPDGVTNSCGVLAQHLVGNLNDYIGKGIGNTGYIRQRELEFTNTGRSKQELINDIEELQETLNDVFDLIDGDKFENEFPLNAPYEASNRSFLIHLYGHLNYHLGQINYLWRLLRADK